MNPINPQADRLASFLLKKLNKAAYEYGMVEDGDRVAVALSGGKDSFGLLRLLRYRRSFVPEKYSVVALHVIGDARGPDMPGYPQLEEWLGAIGVEYLIRPTLLADGERLPVPCQRCTWNRRRTLFEMAVELGCNKLAFGHHLDDLAETALMNLMHHGKNETMAPIRDYFGGKLKVIRPLAYVPESELTRFARASGFPPPPDPCPAGEHTERRHAGELLREMQRGCRHARANIVRSALRTAYGSSVGL